MRAWGAVDVSDFLAVRSLVTTISKEAFDQPTVSSMVSPEPIEVEKEMAKKFGDRAESFDPHSTIFRALGQLSIVKKAIMVILAVTAIIANHYFGIPESRITNSVSTIMSPLMRLGVAGIALYGAWSAYILILKYNRKIVREIIKEIRFEDGEIESETCKKEVRAYRRWNRNLTNSVTLTVVLLLAGIHALAPDIFSYGSETSKDWVPEYVEKRVSEEVEEENDGQVSEPDKENIE